MNTKDTIYISGGEVRVITLMEKLSPQLENGESSGIGRPGVKMEPWSLNATIEKLISEVRENIRAKDSVPTGQTWIDADEMRRILSRAEIARVEFLTEAMTRLLRGIAGIWRRIVLIAGSAPAGR